MGRVQAQPALLGLVGELDLAQPRLLPLGFVTIRCFGRFHRKHRPLWGLLDRINERPLHLNCLSQMLQPIFHHHPLSFWFPIETLCVVRTLEQYPLMPFSSTRLAHCALFQNLGVPLHMDLAGLVFPPVPVIILLTPELVEASPSSPPAIPWV